MKAILVFFLLLASIFFLPSSTLAGQLEGGVTPGTNDPNIRCSPGGSYRSCLPPSPPKPPCDPYIRKDCLP
uniref:Uncharacterized protein n=1 Tax=Glycine max TaxID=3847 RepID=C6TFF8_SOYBN|nr:unknown [Glycine max]